MGIIKINTDYIEDETIAIWLMDLFKNEIDEVECAASNEHIFALGSDNDESATQHEENAELNRQYAEILKDAYNEVAKYWNK